jgi:hypothetical protein
MRRVGEASKLAADGGQLEGLGHDRDAATAQLRDAVIDAVDRKARMTLAGKAHAVAEVEAQASTVRPSQQTSTAS